MNGLQINNLSPKSFADILKNKDEKIISVLKSSIRSMTTASRRKEERIKRILKQTL